MDENKIVLKPEDPVDFSYPDGFKQAAESLNFLPEPAREQILSGFVFFATSFMM